MLLHTSGTGLWRLLMPLSFSFIAAAIVLWRTLRTRPDVLLCVEPTLFCAPAALLAAKLVGARTILHVQDLELDAAVSVGHLSNGMLIGIARQVECFLLRRFDAVITISNKMSDRLAQKGVAAGRLHVIRNWVDLDKIKPSSGPNGFRRELGLTDDDFVVLYAGNLGPKQGLSVLVEAAKLIAHSNIHFVIAGAGPVRQELIESTTAMPNVHWLPLQPEERLNELLNLANLHVVPQSLGTPDLVLPSKLGGALASGRPVLVQAGEGTELHNLLQDAAILVPPGDVPAMAKAILQVVRQPPDVEKGHELARLFSREQNLASFQAVILE
jgi:colanic acid biosynthesis glycosyl transferase WcaI